MANNLKIKQHIIHLRACAYVVNNQSAVGWADAVKP
jgi:hypothetical protein